MIVRREFRFEASHVLPRHPGRCKRLHGHSYKLVIEVAGDIEPKQGMVIDFEALDSIVNERVLSRLDHHHMNDIIENPTAENLSVWIWGELTRDLPGLVSCELFETEGASVICRAEDAQKAARGDRASV